MAVLHKELGMAHPPATFKLHVLAFPCNDFGGQEPDSEQKIEQFARKQYHFFGPMFGKVRVKGGNAHPLFQWLQQEGRHTAQWNFHKWLVDKDGNLVNSWSDQKDINAIKQDILAQAEAPRLFSPTTISPRVSHFLESRTALSRLHPLSVQFGLFRSMVHLFWQLKGEKKAGWAVGG